MTPWPYPSAPASRARASAYCLGNNQVVGAKQVSRLYGSHGNTWSGIDDPIFPCKMVRKTNGVTLDINLTCSSRLERVSKFRSLEVLLLLPSKYQKSSRNRGLTGLVATVDTSAAIPTAGSSARVRYASTNVHRPAHSSVPNVTSAWRSETSTSNTTSPGDPNCGFLQCLIATEPVPPILSTSTFRVCRPSSSSAANRPRVKRCRGGEGNRGRKMRSESYP